jgi:hypothetical protein
MLLLKFGIGFFVGQLLRAELRSIHVQQVDCCDTDFGHSDDHGTVYRPIKVIKPAIALRVEQSRLGSLIREPIDSIGLVSIANSTSKAEVFEFCLAAKRQRIDVFDFEGDNRKRFT